MANTNRLIKDVEKQKILGMALLCLFFMSIFITCGYAVPTATNVQINGPVREGGQIFVTYAYSDPDGIEEGDTRIILYRDGEIIQESDNEVNIYTDRISKGSEIVPVKETLSESKAVGTNADKSTTIYNIMSFSQDIFGVITYQMDKVNGIMYKVREKDIGHRIRAEVIPVNANGVEGIGISSYFTQFVVRPTYIDTDYIKVVTSNTHSLGLKPDGTVWAWGNNTNGCLGIGKTESELTSSEYPVRVMQAVDGTTTLEPLTRITDIACGDGWSFAVHESNFGYCWGYFNSTFTPTNMTVPPKYAGFNGGTNLQNVSSYTNRLSCANTYPYIYMASTSYSWLYRTAANNSSALLSSTGYGFTLGLNKEGYVIAINYNPENGNSPTNSQGQLGQGHANSVLANTWFNVKIDSSTNLSNVTYIKSARNYSIALDKEGYLWFWGNGTLYATKMTGITTIGGSSPTEKVVDYVLLDNKIYVLTEVISTGENKIYETSTLSPTAVFTLNQTSATPMRIYGSFAGAYVNKRVTINGETCLRTYDLSTGNKIPTNPVVTSVAIRRISRVDSDGNTQSIIGPWTRETIANSSSYTGEYIYKLPSDIPDIIRNQLPANTTIDGVTYDPYRVGDTLEGSYDYFDEDGDTESGTIFQWYRSGAPIEGANSITYILTPDDISHEISFKVIPKDGRASGYGEEGLYSSILTSPIFPSLNDTELSDTYIFFTWSEYALKSNGNVWSFMMGVGTLPAKTERLDGNFIVDIEGNFVIRVDGRAMDYNGNFFITPTNILKGSMKGYFFLRQSGELYGRGANKFNQINNSISERIADITQVQKNNFEFITDAIQVVHSDHYLSSLSYLNQNSNSYTKENEEIVLNYSSRGVLNTNNIINKTSNIFNLYGYNDLNIQGIATELGMTADYTYIYRFFREDVDYISREGFTFSIGRRRTNAGGGRDEYFKIRFYNSIEDENGISVGNPLENVIRICSVKDDAPVIRILNNEGLWTAGINSRGELGRGNLDSWSNQCCLRVKNATGNGFLTNILNAFILDYNYDDNATMALVKETINGRNVINLYGWGRNTSGELGTGTVEIETVPRRVQPKDINDLKYYENVEITDKILDVGMHDYRTGINYILKQDGIQGKNSIWRIDQLGNITKVYNSEIIIPSGIYANWKITNIKEVGYCSGTVLTFIADFISDSGEIYNNRLFITTSSYCNRVTSLGELGLYKINLPSRNEELQNIEGSLLAYATSSTQYQFDINQEPEVDKLIAQGNISYVPIVVLDKNSNLWAWGTNANGQLGHIPGTCGDSPSGSYYINKNINLVDTNVKLLCSENTLGMDSNTFYFWIKEEDGIKSLRGCGFNNDSRIFHKTDDETILSSNSINVRELKFLNNLDDNTENDINDIRYISCKSESAIIVNHNSANNKNEIWAWGKNIWANVYDLNGNIAKGNNATPYLHLSSAPRYVTPLKVVWDEDLYGVVDKIESTSFGTYVVLTTNGDLYTFGRGDMGNLGNGLKTNNYTPQHVLSNISKIVTGYKMVSAIDNEGILYRWGDNGIGQLYTGRMTNLLLPTLIGNPVTSFEPSAGLFNNPTAVTNANIDTNGIALYHDIGYKWQRSDTVDDGNIPILTFALGNESTVTSSRDFATDIDTVMNGYYTQEDQTRLAIVSQELLVYPVGQWATQAEALITTLQEELYAIGTDISPLIDGKTTTEKIDVLREYNQTALNVKVSECLNSIDELPTEDERTALATEKEQLETKRDQVAYATEYYQTDGTYYLWIYMYGRTYDIGGNEVQGALYSPTAVKSISGGFPIDKTAPVITDVHIASNVTTPEGTANATIAKEGSRVVISFISNEQIDINRVELVDEVYEKVFKVSINGANQTLNILTSGELTNSGDIKQTQQQDGTYKIEYLFIPTVSTADGTINFAMRGIYDNAGNLHADVTNANITDGSSVLVDNTAPIITYVKSTTLDGKKQITITTYDNGSGVSNYPNQVNPIYVHGGVNNNDYIANGGVIIVSDDATSISIEAYDKAGNLATEEPNIESISVFDITPKNGATIPIYQPIVITFPGEDIDYYTSAEDTLSKISLTYKVTQNGVEVTKNERVAIKSMVADNGETKITIGPVSGLFASNTEYSFIMQNYAIKSTTSGKGYSAITTTFTTSISEITNDTIAIYTVPVGTTFEVFVPGDFGDTSENGISLSGWDSKNDQTILAGIVTAHKDTNTDGKGVIQYTKVKSKPTGFSSEGQKIVYIEALKKYIVFNVVSNPGDTTITV